MRVDLLLRGLARGALTVELGGHTLASPVDAVDAGLQVRQAVAVAVERGCDAFNRFADCLHGVAHGVQVVANVG